MTSRRADVPLRRAGSASEVPPPSGAAPLLDIGGDVGALVVYLAGDTPSGELEACPAGRPAARFHTGVHERPVPGGSRPVAVAVFPEVRAGAYDVLDDDGRTLVTVDVAGGRVREVDLRA
jgi:hypothetical protein